MNTLEKKMVTILRDLKDNYGVSGVKAEYEAEGTRLEEMMRLKEVVMKAGLGLTIKIGGGEAVRDMYECREIGVERIVAPMIESAYALKKYLSAASLAFGEELNDVILACNIETISGVNAFDDMMKVPGIEKLNGIVMGRVDMCGSLGLTREDINSDQVFQLTQELLTKAKAHRLENAVGGGVSKYSLPFFEKLPAGVLDRFETRKVIFNYPCERKTAEDGIFKAVGFELLWLKNKQSYYRAISDEDTQRIAMLESRYRDSIEMVGGTVG